MQLKPRSARILKIFDLSIIFVSYFELEIRRRLCNMMFLDPQEN